MTTGRQLLVVADDFGIGPDTSRGILELAGTVTATTLLVNSPHAADAVRRWCRAAAPPELGWHANLTLDAPAAPRRAVPSLLAPDGRFWPLAPFLRRLLTGRLRAAEIETEFHAQLDRFLALVGRPPRVVNAHHHCAVFPPVGDILLRVLSRCRPRPVLRRVREPWGLLRHVPGARLKRLVLSAFGRWHARAAERAGFAGADWLAGVTDPERLEDPGFFGRWLRHTPGRVVELMCHPGHPDPTLVGRDGPALRRRDRERRLLGRPDFLRACDAAGFRLVAPPQLTAAADVPRAA